MARRAQPPGIADAVAALAPSDLAMLGRARGTLRKIGKAIAPPRDACAFGVRAGQFFRIVCTEGPKVGDLTLRNADDLAKRFFCGRARAIEATHLRAGARLCSSPPHLRPMATIKDDTLAWYGVGADGTLAACAGGDLGVVHRLRRPRVPPAPRRDAEDRASPARHLGDARPKPLPAHPRRGGLKRGVTRHRHGLQRSPGHARASGRGSRTAGFP